MELGPGISVDVETRKGRTISTVQETLLEELGRKTGGSK